MLIDKLTYTPAVICDADPYNVDYLFQDACICGQPRASEDESFCPDCRAQHENLLSTSLARLPNQVEPNEVQLLPNGNLHIRINGMTAFCGGMETAQALYQALGQVFLSPDEQADVDRLAQHIRNLSVRAVEEGA